MKITRYVARNNSHSRRLTIAEIAHQYLVSRGFDRVCYGDAILLHEIAEAAGRPHNSWVTEKNILNALEGSSLFEKRYFRARRGLARTFVVKVNNEHRTLRSEK